MKIEIKILNKEFYKVDKLGGSYYDTPQYQTSGSAAVDLRCTENIIIYPGETRMIPTGLAIWIGSSKNNMTAIINNETLSNMGVAGIILPRSGLGNKGLVLANTIGLIDSDYQGELSISAWNRNETNWGCFLSDDKMYKDVGHSIIELHAGDRIAQLMFVPFIKAEWVEVDEFSTTTARYDGGFGSTGI